MVILLLQLFFNIFNFNFFAKIMNQRVYFISLIIAVVLDVITVLTIQKQNSKSTAPNWNEKFINSDFEVFLL